MSEQWSICSVQLARAGRPHDARRAQWAAVGARPANPRALARLAVLTLPFARRRRYRRTVAPSNAP